VIEVDLACRLCDRRPLEVVLSLGLMPLVNAFAPISDDTPGRSYPLDVARCPTCSLVQITRTVPPEILFRDYAYFSSYSTTFLDHARSFAEGTIAKLSLTRESFVIEAASNDGYLLQFFQQGGVPALGIEPAENVADVARTAGIETVAAFLDPILAAEIVAKRGTADLVVANNVLAHAPDLHGFMTSLSILAGADGLISIEVPYLIDLIDKVEFDTIYHEHVFYFSLTALSALAKRHALTVRDVERLSVHGGSLRITLGSIGEPAPVVGELLAAEERWGVRSAPPFERFASEVNVLREKLHDLVSGLVAGGSSVAGYGAAAKGVVLANACGLDRNLVDFVADRNPAKQGRRLPGVGIPVREPDALARDQPDYCLLFAWNLADEIVDQQTAYQSRGGKFILPVPTPRVLNA
jgi:hypothetical protein